jgi:crotonobetainyl-CoA:carnitine CoA-transferase CaiB-like acyl-CoA transferase
VVCCDTEAQWRSLCKAAQREDLVHDPRFVDGNARTRHHAALEPLLSEVFLTKTRKAWIELLTAADVPCGPVNSIADIAADPQVAARQMTVQVGGGRFTAQPVRMASVDPRNERPAPQLGQHTAEILRELGYTDQDIEALMTT